MPRPEPTSLTDAALAAAVRKAVEVGLLPTVNLTVVIPGNWERIRDVVQAALDASAGPLYAVRVIYIPMHPPGEPVEAVMLRHADRAEAERLAEELARLPMYERVRVVEEGER